MIFAVGDIGVDFNVAVDHLPGPDEKVHTSDAYVNAGGVIVNFAAAAVRLGSQVSICGRVGTDPLGVTAVSQLKAAGVVTEHVREDPTISTYYSVAIVDRDGEKRLIVVESPSLYPAEDQVSGRLPLGTEWCHTVPYDLSAAIELAKAAQGTGVPLSVDLEPATFANRSLSEFIPLLRRCDSVILNRRAAAMLADTEGAAADLIRRVGAKVVVVTLGDAGVLVSANGRKQRIPGFVTDVVDSTGAGDVFAAAYVHWRLMEESPFEAARYAAAAGAFACQAMGAQGSLPTEANVRDLVAAGSTS
ncbi:MAG: carbohydrate kinase family protein [Acidimicrobiia bacterium]